jgi:hypothetical protein
MLRGRILALFLFISSSWDTPVLLPYVAASAIPSFCFSSSATAAILRVRTHQQSRIEPNPVRLTKTRRWLCGLLTTPAAAVRAHQQSRVESLVAACFIFFSQPPVIVRDGCYLKEEMYVKKLILLVKGYEAICGASSRTKYNGILIFLPGIFLI